MKYLDLNFNIIETLIFFYHFICFEPNNNFSPYKPIIPNICLGRAMMQVSRNHYFDLIIFIFIKAELSVNNHGAFIKANLSQMIGAQIISCVSESTNLQKIKFETSERKIS